ncbi:hypothetical protein FHS25_001786 [Rhizobium laguerreae]|uniref:Nucleoside 2-deoxyribosyltransferase n=1 Tax=Rhizobium laguerreae TaxID=1076926 RepID=A0ABR6G4Y9_9HYPH|nr:hypothetical protein [Rhizobium laguerreae]MBB3161337.1 hypothetical protein [Rhizobium laguerreae]
MDLVARQDEIRRAAERYEIFIAGPYIDVTKPRTEEVNSLDKGKLIRFDVYQYYNDSGHNIYMGEDVELQKIGQKHYGNKSNAAFFERHYIIDNIDTVIMFPFGPGAFCELGDWATTKSTCEKMLVLIAKEFEGKPSYINDGTAKAARHFGAEIVYVDYENFDEVIGECNRFIESRATDARVEKLFDR